MSRHRPNRSLRAALALSRGGCRLPTTKEAGAAVAAMCGSMQMDQCDSCTQVRGGGARGAGAWVNIKPAGLSEEGRALRRRARGGGINKQTKPRNRGEGEYGTVCPRW